MSSIFGGGTSKASRQSQQAQLQANREMLDFVKEQANKAESSARTIFPAVGENRRAGIDTAMGVFAQGIPQQISAIQQGSQGAQGILAQGLPQIQNAILGLPTNTNFQPQSVQVDTSFLNAQLPQFTNPVDLLNAAQPAPPPNPLANLPFYFGNLNV